MTREDIGRVAKGAPALHRVVVVTLPDCLLVKQWARSETQDAEAVAAHLGAAFRAAIDALRALGAAAPPDGLTIEARDCIVVVTALAEDAAAGFLFDRTAPLGLVRMQVRQLSEHLAGLVAGISRDLPTTTPTAAESPNATAISPPRATEAPRPAPSVRAPLVPPPAPAATATPAPAAPAGATRPRAVKLLEFFRRFAPDPHASMLRLSLRTGISLEALDQPEQLNEVQVEAIAASVSDILGQDPIGV